MRILLVSQHYWPETVGTARRAQLLAEFFAASGHQVSVLCGRPNHPSMADLFSTGHDGLERHSGVEIFRLPVYRATLAHTTTSGQADISSNPDGAAGSPYSAANGWRLSARARIHRWLTYGSWVVHGALTVPNLQDDWDVIVAVSPLPTGLIGVLVSLRLKRPLVFDLQDIWPDAAVQAGILKSPRLIRVMTRAERWTYRHTRALVVLSEGFGKNIEQKGVSRERVHVIPNSVDITTHKKDLRVAGRRELGLAASETLVVYAGNMGLVQDLDVVLEAADGLRHVKEIRFLLVGEGVDRKRLTEIARSRGLSQVKFMAHQPASRIPTLLAAADICLLSLRPQGYTPGTIPSKLYEYLAAGRAIVNLVDGDVRDVIDASEAGINLPPGDARALRIALLALHADPGLREKMGRAARAYVEREASISVVGGRYEALLWKLLEREDHGSASSQIR